MYYDFLRERIIFFVENENMIYIIEPNNQIIRTDLFLPSVVDNKMIICEEF